MPKHRLSIIATTLGLFLAAWSTPTSHAPRAPSATVAATPSIAADPTAAPTTLGLANAARLALVPEGSRARYVAREQLANLQLPSEATGSTQEVAGTITLSGDGHIVPQGSSVTVDLTTLRSDEQRRDNFLRRNTLETFRFPLAEFVPREIQGFLPLPLPSSGETNFQLVGNLTIRDVVRPVTWQVTAEFTERGMNGKATTSITFSQFNLEQPRVFLVYSIEETIRLELDFQLSREP